ncbi:MAG TPA: hypothetical protein VJP78_12535, partial [Thermoleophilia bacterium]|nr:hypothetical protein [Thermoleophilia bacterium]
MVRLRRSPKIGGGLPPGGRARRAALLSSAIALCLCALAACAFLSPGLVFGADQPRGAAGVGRPLATGPGQPDASNAGSAATSAEGTLGASQGTLLVKLPWGAGPGQVGLEGHTEGLTRGPEAVAVSPNGRIVVLDSVNRRLVILDASGTFLGAIPVGLTGPRFLAVSETALYVLDCDYDPQLASFDWNGGPLGTERLPVFDDVVTGLFATDSGVCIEVAHDRTFLVAPAIGTAATGLGTGSGHAEAALKPLAGRPIDKSFGAAVRVSFEPGKDAQIRLFKVDKSTLKALQTADFTSPVYGKRALEHLVSVDGDGQGGLVIGGRILGTASPAP